jgi:hypothetical protein
LFFISPVDWGGLEPSFAPPIQRTADSSNVKGVQSFDAIAFFATNAGAPMTAPGIVADGITHLYHRLGGEPTGEQLRNNLMVGKAETRTSYYSRGGALIASHSLPLQQYILSDTHTKDVGYHRTKE